MASKKDTTTRKIEAHEARISAEETELEELEAELNTAEESLSEDSLKANSNPSNLEAKESRRWAYTMFTEAEAAVIAKRRELDRLRRERDELKGE